MNNDSNAKPSFYAKRKRRFGDRRDGWRLRGIAPYNTISPYVMVERNDASNLFSDRFSLEKVEPYVRQKRNEGYKTFGIMHVMLAAYIRAIAEKPFLNRFLSGQKIYARNSIQINMVVKRTMTREEVDTVIKVFFEPTDTALEVYQKMDAAIEKAYGDDASDFDDTARILNYIPGLFKKFAFFFLKFLDYFGLLPGILLKVSPFHGSLFITSMGSLGIPPIYHHLYNFGNVPVFISFGAKYTSMELDEDGKPVKRRYVDYRVVTDERICDGFSYASALRTFRRYLANPVLLDNPPEAALEDPDIDPQPKKKKQK